MVVGYDRAFGSKGSTALVYSTTTIAPIDKFTGRVTSILETSGGNYLIGGFYTGYTDQISTKEANGVIRLSKTDGTIDTLAF